MPIRVVVVVVVHRRRRRACFQVGRDGTSIFGVSREHRAARQAWTRFSSRRLLSTEAYRTYKKGRSSRAKPNAQTITGTGLCSSVGSRAARSSRKCAPTVPTQLCSAGSTTAPHQRRRPRLPPPHHRRACFQVGRDGTSIFGVSREHRAARQAWTRFSSRRLLSTEAYRTYKKGRSSRAKPNAQTITGTGLCSIVGSRAAISSRKCAPTASTQLCSAGC